MTYNQLINNKKKRKLKLKKTPALRGNPQKRGVVISVFTKTPRKPNSALRKVAKVRLVNLKTIIAFIPGEGHNIQRFNDVMVRGGRVRDLPGVKYVLVRGKLDLLGIDSRKSSRSKYGRKLYR